MTDERMQAKIRKLMALAADPSAAPNEADGHARHIPGRPVSTNTNLRLK